MIKTDCHFYKGEKPCLYHLKKGLLCRGCHYYKRVGQKEAEKRKKLLKHLRKIANLKNRTTKKGIFNILVIKFGAAGDVLRTTPILKTLKKKYPSSRITWISTPESAELLAGNPRIDTLFLADTRGIKKALEKKYDLLLSLDKETRAITLASAVKSEKKLGFRMNDFGALDIFNKESLYALRLGIDNRLKYRTNNKSYQSIIYKMSCLGLRYGRYALALNKKYVRCGRRILSGFGVRPSHTVIGLNTGAGKVFMTKKWPEDYFVKLSGMLGSIKGVKTILLGGHSESLLNKKISQRTLGKAINVGTHYSKKDFAGIMRNCDIIVTSDTLSMHLAIALKRPVIVLFGPTARKEIDLYGLGKKIYSKIPCSPCYKSRCKDARCMKSILPKTVFGEVKKLI